MESIAILLGATAIVGAICHNTKATLDYLAESRQQSQEEWAKQHALYGSEGANNRVLKARELELCERKLNHEMAIDQANRHAREKLEVQMEQARKEGQERRVLRNTDRAQLAADVGINEAG